MFFVLSKTLDLLVAPITWIIVLALLGVPFRKRELPRWRRFAPAAAALVAVIFSSEVVSNALFRSLEAPPIKTVKPGVTYDVVVLLGGVIDERASQTYGERSYNDSVERLTTTYDLLREARARFAIVSGASEPREGIDVVEAVALRDQLVAWGIASDRVIVEDKAKNTRDNAVESARIIHERGFTTIVIVTSAFHMPRALGCFRAVGLDVDTLPVDYRGHERWNSWLPRARFLDDSTIALREWTGRGVYRLRGYSK
ncbi:YdcF family protein [soil metagenome]